MKIAGYPVLDLPDIRCIPIFYVTCPTVRTFLTENGRPVKMNISIFVPDRYLNFCSGCKSGRFLLQRETHLDPNLLDCFEVFKENLLKNGKNYPIYLARK